MTGLLLVSGLTRCGTSLLMQMLSAGGFPIVGGHMGWPAFEHDVNVGGKPLPRGTVGALKWLDPHRERPPKAQLSVYLQRDKAEQSRSIGKFLRAIGVPVDRGFEAASAADLRADEPVAIRALEAVGPVLVATFEDMVTFPMAIVAAIEKRTGQSIDVNRAMSAFRARGKACLPYMLEERLLQEKPPGPA
jgi:hypothetical protein